MLCLHSRIVIIRHHWSCSPHFYCNRLVSRICWCRAAGVARASSSWLEKEPWQVPHPMKNAHDHNRLAPHLIKDQIVAESHYRPGAHAGQLAKVALGAYVWGLGNE